MKLISVNVGLPREVIWHGRIVTTGIFKEPVDGRVSLRKVNLDGDGQADLGTVRHRRDHTVCRTCREGSSIRGWQACRSAA